MEEVVADIQFDPADDPVAWADAQVASKIPHGDDSELPDEPPNKGGEPRTVPQVTE